jgi:putative flippase GtrA
MDILNIILVSRFLKFSIIGLISTIINYSIFFILFNTFNIFYVFSSIVGYVIGLLFGYYFNKKWTFSNKILAGKSYIIKYTFCQILGLISQQIVLIILVEILLIDPIFSNIISIGFAAIVSFLLIENFVIEKNEHKL